MHANAAEALLPFLAPGARVLDVGSGSGYLCAVFGQLVAPGGTVVGIEHIPQLVALSETNLRKDPRGAAMLADGTVKIVKGDGRLGWPAEGECTLSSTAAGS